MSDEVKNKGGKLVLMHGGPDEELIAVLEHALSDAKKGVIIGGALLLQGPNGSQRQELAGSFHSGDLFLQWEATKLDLIELEFGDDDADDADDDDKPTNDDDSSDPE